MQSLILTLILITTTPSTLLTQLGSANGGEAYSIYQELKSFDRNVFSQADKNLILQLLQNTTPHYTELILLSGFLEIEAAKPVLIQLMDSAGLKNDTRWASCLALARMSHPKAVEIIKKRIDQLPINDDFIYALAPQIVYTRNKELYGFLINILNSDNPFCTSTNPDNEVPIPCAYRIMEYMAPAVKNYPLKISFTGDIDTKDYRKALSDVREWFATNGQEYEMKRDVY